ncbi:MAG TPA: hypothetical protein VM223_23220 [Planctomycetota bacterium]|nr:hypothetical protein [Planctomycetota bacterium]
MNAQERYNREQANPLSTRIKQGLSRAPAPAKPAPGQPTPIKGGGLVEAAARPYATFAEKFLVGPGRRAYRGLERATGLDLPWGLPREKLPLPGTPEQQAAAARLGAGFVQEASLGAYPAEKALEHRRRVEPQYFAGLPELGTQAKREAEATGRGMGFLTWFSRFGPGGLIHGAGKTLEAVRPTAKPLVSAVLRRFGEAVPLAVGHGAGVLQEGATLKESGLTAAKTAAIWMVMAPIVEGFLKGVTGRSPGQLQLARERAEGHANQWMRGVAKEGRVPSEAEAAAAAERIVATRAKELKVNWRGPRAVRPQLFGETAPQRNVRQVAEMRAAIAAGPEKMPLISEEGTRALALGEEAVNAEAYIAQKSEAAAIVTPAKPKPQATTGDIMAAEAEARDRAMQALVAEGLPKAKHAEAERLISEIGGPRVPEPPEIARPVPELPPRRMPEPKPELPPRPGEPAVVPELPAELAPEGVAPAVAAPSAAEAAPAAAMTDHYAEELAAAAGARAALADKMKAEMMDVVLTDLRRYHKRIPRTHQTALRRMVSDFEDGLIDKEEYIRTLRSLEDREMKPKYWGTLTTRLGREYFSPEGLERAAAPPAVSPEALRTAPTPTPAEAWTAATGQKAVDVPGPAQPSPLAMRRGKGTTGRAAGAVRMPEAEKAREAVRGWLGGLYAEVSEIATSVDGLVRSTGPSGKKYMDITDRAFARWKQGRDTAYLDTNNILRGIPKKRQEQVYRYLDGRIPERMLSRQERAAAAELRPIIDSFDIRGLKNGAITIRAKQEIELPDGTVIPKTPEGRDVWSDMRLAQDWEGSVDDLLSRNTVPVQLVNPETAEVLPTVYQLSRDQVYVPARSNYITRAIDPKFLDPKKQQARLAQVLMRRGDARNMKDASRIIEAYKSDRVDPYYNPLRQARLQDLPEEFYIPQGQALDQYFNGASRNLAWADNVGAGTSLRKEGWLGEELLRGATTDAEAEGVASWTERNWVATESEARQMLGDLSILTADAVRQNFNWVTKEAAPRWGARLHHRLRSAVAVGSLGRVTLTNLTQPMNTVVMTSLKDTMAGMVGVLDKATREQAIRSGAVKIEGLAAVAGVSGQAWHQRLAKWFIQKGYLLGPMEQWLRTVAAIASRRFAKSTFERLVQSPRDKWAREALRILRIDADKALARGKLTEEELMDAAFWGAGETQFLTRATDMPVWYNTEGGKTIAMLMGFMYQQGKLIQRLAKRDIMMGDPAKAIKFLVGVGIGMPLAGEIVQNLKAELSLTPRTSYKWERWLDDLFAGGGLGIAFEMFYDALRYGAHGDMFAGPALQQLAEGIGAGFELLDLRDKSGLGRPRTEAEERRAKEKAARWFTKRIPVPYALGAARYATEALWPTNDDAPFWVRELDVRQSMWPPTWDTSNIHEQRADWNRKNAKEKQQHWMSLAPAARVNFFLKLPPEERYRQLDRIGEIGRKQLVENAKKLGPNARKRLIWAIEDAQRTVQIQAVRETMEAEALESSP